MGSLDDWFDYVSYTRGCVLNLTFCAHLDGWLV